MLLSAPAIRRHMEWGSVVIEPFDIARLNTNTYDLELGHFFWRYDRVYDREPSNGKGGFLRVDASSIGGLWLGPHERILGHTVEIAGGRVADVLGSGKRLRTAVTTQMHATSTAGRHGLTVCQCAGVGDVGYVSRWTLEIGNQLDRRIWLPVGAIIAQVSFHEVEAPDFEYRGRYGVGDWTPESMLPGPLKVSDHGRV